MTEKIFFPQQIAFPESSGRTQEPEIAQEKSFADLLAKETIKFSRHAQERIASRAISLHPGHLERLHEAVEKAAAKGARESLVLVDNLAFVVSIKNRTVVTAVDDKNLKGNVFTNIDSAVIV